MGTPARALAVRLTAAILLSAGALLAIASARLVLDGRSHYHEGEKQARDGDRARALLELEEAARAYVPGSPFPRRAIERMGIIAKGHEMRGDIASALAAWESVRRAVLSTRHLIQPNADQLERAEREIERLRRASDDPRSGGSDPVARPDDPSPVASLLLFAGLLAWVGGALALLVRPARSENKTRFSLGLLAAWVACLGGLILWLAMSYFAG